MMKKIKYKMGSRKKYDGLVTHLKDVDTIGDPKAIPPNREEAEKTMSWARDAIKRKGERGIKPVNAEKTRDWDLELMLPDLAAMLFSDYLAERNLPSEFTPHLLGSDQKQRVPFKTRLLELAIEKKLNEQEQRGVCLAADGLFEISCAESNVKNENFEMAAIHIGRAMPIAVVLNVIKMEHSWHNGQSYQNKNKSKAEKERKPELGKIYRKLAKRKKAGETPKDLWPIFIEDLHNATDENGAKPFDDVKSFYPNSANVRTWRVEFYGKSGPVKIRYEAYLKGLRK
ncbi:hypothetical protein CA267_016670 [Alteromonas pelagimontana]|uniref:Uncharacterized protein n=1 Tax=Alteromonas pelagimontana TaxID=1858656 RepID=A0A6M4MH17_9ALTE|nr:hypothetical protein [Alteromonas pelagimontana]QJR82267.1 hypothetical protein CA267_016670 [Alteromonas pelagimontana]